MEMGAELRIGFREVGEFDDFVVLSELIQDCVREKCFASATPYDNYVICSAKRDSKLAKPSERIDDSKLKAQVTIEDYGVEILSEEPMYLTRALKKYFPI